MSRSSTSSSDETGLVPAPPDVARSGWRRVGAPAIILLFLLSTAGAGILDLIAPAPGPPLTQSRERLRNAERAAAGIADGSLMRVIDRDLQEQSNVRWALTPWYIAYGLLPLREGGSGILVGPEGWLFLEDRIYPMGGSHRPEHGTLAANIVTALDRRLAALGIDTAFLIVPRKATMATRFVPRDCDVGPAFEQDLLRLLRERDIPHVNVYDVFQGIDPALTWQRQDTHWSSQGMWRALNAAAHVLGRWVPPEERDSTMEPGVPTPVDRKLLMTMGIPREHPVLAHIRHEHLPAPHFDAPSLEALPEDGPEVLILGTSFTDNLNATQQLSHLVNRPVVNLSAAGATFGITLAKALTSGALPSGSQLVLEIPSFQLQGGGFRSEGTLLLKDVALEALLQASPPQWSAVGPDLLEKTPFMKILPVRLLGTTGDGIVSIELSGKPADSSDVTVTLSNGNTQLTVSWPTGAESIHLPIITSEPYAPFIRVMIRGAPAEHSIQMRFVTELDLENSVPLLEARVERLGKGEGWQQERRIPPGTLLGRHAALWIRLPPKGLADTLEVELISPDGEPHPVATVPLRLGGTALLTLSAPPGNWRWVRISGSGASAETRG